MDLDFFSREISKYGSRPAELYEFSYANNYYYYTSSDSTILFGGNAYKPETINRNAIISSPEKARNDLEINITQNNILKNFLFTENIKDNLKLTIYRVQIADGTAESMFSGTLSSFEVVNEFELKLYFMQVGQFALKRTQKATYQSTCLLKQYSVQCGLNLLANSEKFILKEISDANTFLKVETIGGDAGLRPNRYFTAGLLWYYDENLLEIRREILVDNINLTQREIIIDYGIEFLPINTEIFLAFGCKRKSENCITVNNFNNFVGFEYIPQENWFLKPITEE